MGNGKAHTEDVKGFLAVSAPGVECQQRVATQCVGGGGPGEVGC